jgi:hypothetical protein
MCNNAEGLVNCCVCATNPVVETARSALEYAIIDRETEEKALKILKNNINWSALSEEEDQALKELFYKLL